MCRKKDCPKPRPTTQRRGRRVELLTRMEEGVLRAIILEEIALECLRRQPKPPYWFPVGL